MKLPPVLLAALLALPPAFCGCRNAALPPPPNAPKIIEEVTPQIVLQLQVIALRETANPSDEAPFPALGFQFAGDRVVPVGKPDTIAGVELTKPQLDRWLENLNKDGAKLYALLPPLAVGPNLRASSADSAEKRYQANWHVDSHGATMLNEVVNPGLKLFAQPDLVPGAHELLTSVEAEIGTADLDPFTLVEGFFAPKKGEKPLPLSVFLPRQSFRRIATQALVQPGQVLVLAHYVKQYRSAPQPAIPLSQGGPERHSNAAAKPAEDLREHLFYLLSAERTGPETQSDLPIVPQIPPRYALSVTWLEAEDLAPSSPPTPAMPPDSTPGEPGELRNALLQMKNAPGAVSQMLSLALTAKTQAQFEISEERGCVAGIHPDSNEPKSPYSFLINRLWSGMKLSAKLEQTPQGVSAALNLRLADPPRCDDTLGKLPSPPTATGAPEPPAKEYHFQTVRQASADYIAPQILQPGQTRILPMAWRRTGEAVSPNALRLAAVSLKESPEPAAETGATAPQVGAPGHP